MTTFLIVTIFYYGTSLAYPESEIEYSFQVPKNFECEGFKRAVNEIIVQEHRSKGIKASIYYNCLSSEEAQEDIHEPD